MARRKPVPRFDYAYLSGLQSPDAPREIFVLDEAAQQVLSQLAEVVLWRTRWDNASEDDADFVQFRGSIYEALKVPYHFDDLIPLFDDVESLLSGILATQCCTDPYGDVLGDAEGLQIIQTWPEPPSSDFDIAADNTWPPDYEADPTGATDFVDAAAVSQYVCELAYLVTQALIDLLRFAKVAKQLAWGIAGLIQRFFSHLLEMRIGGVVGQIVAFSYDQLYEQTTIWIEAVDSVVIDLALAAIIEQRDDLACAIASADTFAEAYEAARDILETFLPAAVYALLTTGGWLNFLLVMVYRGYLTPGVWRGRECCAPPYDFDFTFTWDSDTQGWAVTRWTWQAPGYLQSYTSSGSEMRVGIGNLQNYINVPDRPYGIQLDLLTFAVLPDPATWHFATGDKLEVFVWDPNGATTGDVVAQVTLDANNTVPLGVWTTVSMPGLPVTQRITGVGTQELYFVLRTRGTDPAPKIGIDHFRVAGTFVPYVPD